jgi:hypothetical protein
MSSRPKPSPGVGPSRPSSTTSTSTSAGRWRTAAGPARAFGISALERLESPSRAVAQARRLVTANGSSEPGLSARAIAVPGIPGAVGARKPGAWAGRDLVAHDVVWVDGPLVHELFALGLADRLRQADVLAAATAIHDRTAGAPPPQGRLSLNPSISRRG